MESNTPVEFFEIAKPPPTQMAKVASSKPR